MLPSHVHTQELLTVPSSAPGSAEAWFAMPALWITRGENAAALPALRRQKLNPADGLTQDGPPTPLRSPPSPPPFPCLLSDQSCLLEVDDLRQTALCAPAV